MTTLPIIITLPKVYKNEGEAIERLIECGAEIIHLRKPESSHDEISELLQSIKNPECKNKLTIHYDVKTAIKYNLGGVHLRIDELNDIPNSLRKSASCHTWEEVLRANSKADYVFLSPIFNSISKNGYRAAFTENDLQNWLKETHRPEVVALGGISAEKIIPVKNLGFDGTAILGSIWIVDNNKIDIEKTLANWKQIIKT